MMSWDDVYNLLGIRDFIYFISSPSIQASLFPLKLVFVAFTLFFFIAVMYFYLNSSYIQFHFLQDATEFILWAPYGARSVNRLWKKIMKNTEFGSENEFKLAVIEADDLLHKVLEDNGYKGETFEEKLMNADRRKLSNFDALLQAHSMRNAIVYNPNYKVEIEAAKRALGDYELAVKNLAKG